MSAPTVNEAQPSDFIGTPSNFAPSNFAPSGFVSMEALPGAPAEGLNWLLGRDSHQRRYIGRTLVGFSAYAVNLATVAVGYWQGLIGPGAAPWLLLGLMLTMLAIYAALRSGWSMRFGDASLTLPQIIVAMSWVGVLYACSGRAHTTQLTMLMLAMAVGVFNMDMRGSRIACAYGVVLMSVVIGALAAWQPALYPPRAEFFNWVLVVSCLPTVTLLRVQLTRLRMRLKTERAELRQALLRLKDLATHDELTGLHNRTHMTEMLQHYVRRHEHRGEPFALALLDLDLFKQINDRYGHAVGDDVLRAFANQARATLRQIDIVARWGGEEFLVLCPKSTASEALIGVERLRSAMAGLLVSAEQPDLRVSFSAGLSEPATGEPIEAAIARADAALYTAKAAGRNRSALSQASPPSVA